jgi:hypothetical protein
VDKDKLKQFVIEEARRQNVPEEVALHIVEKESNWNPLAVSKKKAVGLMQLMPETAKELGLVIAKGVDDRLNPEKNAQAGLKYLRKLYDQFGSWSTAAGAYNAGPGRMEQWLKGDLKELPEETRAYMANLPASFFPDGTPGTFTPSVAIVGKKTTPGTKPSPDVIVGPKGQKLPDGPVTEIHQPSGLRKVIDGQTPAQPGVLAYQPTTVPNLFPPSTRQEALEVDKRVTAMGEQAAAEKYSWSRMWDAAVAQNHIVPSLMAKHAELSAASAGYDPDWVRPQTDRILQSLQDRGIPAVPDYVRRLKEAANQKHYEAILSRMSMELQDEEVLASRGAGVGFLMNFVGSLTDPTQMPLALFPAAIGGKAAIEAGKLPEVAAALSAAKRGNAIRGTLGGAAMGGGSEALLYSLQETRTTNDVLSAVLASGTLGFLGGRFQGVEVSNLGKLVAQYEDELIRKRSGLDQLPPAQSGVPLLTYNREGEYIPRGTPDPAGSPRGQFEFIVDKDGNVVGSQRRVDETPPLGLPAPRTKEDPGTIYVSPGGEAYGRDTPPPEFAVRNSSGRALVPVNAVDRGALVIDENGNVIAAQLRDGTPYPRTIEGREPMREAPTIYVTKEGRAFRTEDAPAKGEDRIKNRNQPKEGEVLPPEAPTRAQGVEVVIDSSGQVRGWQRRTQAPPMLIEHSKGGPSRAYAPERSTLFVGPNGEVMTAEAVERAFAKAMNAGPAAVDALRVKLYRATNTTEVRKAHANVKRDHQDIEDALEDLPVTNEPDLSVPTTDELTCIR